MNLAKYLHSPVSKFTHIVHVADIHIRLTKRHDEYREIFDKFYDDIKKTPDTTLIAVLGDVFHNKSDLTPECVQLASDFLKRLADLRPTLLIAGNHDATLNNKNRLDSLSPLVNALNHPNLFYLVESGLFVLGNLLFNHYSVFDDFTKYVKFSDIPKKILNETDCKIALFHGPVQGAITDFGFRVVSKTIGAKTFDGHDIVLLGDIHKFQLMQEHSVNYEQPVILYPGSMIQQNHGELLNNHGYVIWEVQTKEFKHVELKNDYGFFTIEIDKGKLYTDISNMPKKVTLRAKCKETVPSEVKALMAKLSDKHQLVEITYDKVESEDEVTKRNIDLSTLNISNISTNIEYQNKLISEFLVNKKKEVMTDDLLKQIIDINNDINSKIKKEFIVRSIRWKPKKFEFENMFSYGEGNVIDFENMRGIVGLFAKNASGKSSILSALSYCLFDKCDRAFKAVHVLNSKKMSFNCKFNFSIEDKNYYIEKRGNRDKKGAVKVDVKFYYIENGKPIDLNGEARRDTNEVIRDYIGTYDDFLLTVLSVQNSSAANFIDMGQSDRKDLIAKFMGITLYDELENIAKSENKEICALLKNYSKTEYPKLLEQRIQEIDQLERQLKSDNIELEKLEKYIAIENEKLLLEVSGLINIGNVPTNISDLTNSRTDVLSQIYITSEKIESTTSLISNIKTELENNNLSLKAFDSSDINNKISIYRENKKLLSENLYSVDKKLFEIATMEATINQLQSHKYNVNCEDCVARNNHIIKDLESTNSKLEILRSQYHQLIQISDKYESIINELNDIEYKFAKLNELKETISYLNQKLYAAEIDLLKCQSVKVQYERKLESINSNIELYNKEKNAVESNRVINERIQILKGKISKLEIDIKASNRKISDLTGKLTVAMDQKCNYEKIIKDAKTWELQQVAYTYYCMAISRDGIPYELITKALPAIEKEINNILRQIVEFTIELNTDGKNVVGYINYDGGRWVMELGSGLEKFALSLAIRVALISISNLPRPNFIAIDEGFGCADKENLNSMSALMSHFKHIFDFVWVISHLDVMKDMADHQIEIKKENNFSKIVVV